mmetsp:Transcript_832/g.1017  ORF Transcript_832/g.1017 Transcript_832/m.1017 type:complete len:102 (+) Transcript_832:662-967(+)
MLKFRRSPSDGETSEELTYSRHFPLEFGGWKNKTLVKFNATPGRKSLRAVKIQADFSLDDSTGRSFATSMEGLPKSIFPQGIHAITEKLNIIVFLMFLIMS